MLLDLGLPDAAGLDAVERLVAVADDVPVIVLTGRHDGSGDDAVAAGAQDYLVKDDITPELLDRSIRYARERRRALRAELRLRAERSQRAERSRLERGLLPTPLLRSDRIECSTYYQPGSDLAVLGGDFFDVVETADGRVRAVIGDVMGHGPDEAALGVHLRVAWRTLVLAGAPDDWILGTLARLLKAESDGPFVTACDLSIELDGTVSVRVAGHPAPLLCADGGPRAISTSRSGSRSGLERAAGHRSGRRTLPSSPSARRWCSTPTGCSTATGRTMTARASASPNCWRPPISASSTAARWSPGCPALVDSAAGRHDDDTAVVVLTRRF